MREKEIEINYIEGDEEIRHYRVMRHIGQGVHQGSSLRVNKVTAHALADAIYNDLGLGWKRYIPGESEPEVEDKEYDTTIDELTLDKDGHETTIRYTRTLWWRDGGGWTDEYDLDFDSEIIAFRERSQPYEEE